MFRSWYVAGLLCLLAAVRAAAQPAIDLAQHAPADSCLALTTAELAGTCRQFQQTRLGALVTGPTFRPLIEALRSREQGGPLYLRPVVGFDWAELEQQATAAGLFVFPLAEDKLGLVWLFAGRPSETEGPWAAAVQYFRERGFRPQASQRQSLSLTVFEPPAELSDESPRVLIAGTDFYGVANSTATAEALLKVTPATSLATQAAWQRSATASAEKPSTENLGTGDIRLLVRPIPLWELVRASGDEAKSPDPAPANSADDQPAADPLASSRQLGFDALEAVSGRIVLSAGDRDWRISTAVLAARPLAKAMRLLAFESGPLPELDTAIGHDVTSASVWNWDFPTAMRGFGNLFDESNEPGPDGVGLFEDLLDGLRDDPEGVQVDLRREVFANLGPRITNLTDRHGPRDERTPDGERSLYIAQVRNESVVADALTRFYRDDDRVTHRQQGAYQLWTVPAGASLFVEGESESVVSIRALALGEGRMLFGTDEQQLLAALAGTPSQPLRDQPLWSAAWQALGERAGNQGALWSLTRLDELLAPAYRQATSELPKDLAAEKQGSTPGETDAVGKEPAGLAPLAALWRIALFGTARREAEVPLSAAPAYDQVRGALPSVGTVLIPTGDGWQLEVDAWRREE